MDCRSALTALALGPVCETASRVLTGHRQAKSVRARPSSKAPLLPERTLTFVVPLSVGGPPEVASGGRARGRRPLVVKKRNEAFPMALKDLTTAAALTKVDDDLTGGAPALRVQPGPVLGG